MISCARVAIPNKDRWVTATTGRPLMMMHAQLLSGDGRSGLRPQCIGYSRDVCSSSINRCKEMKYIPTTRKLIICNSKPSSQFQQCFSSSTVSKKSTTQVFQYGNNEDRIHFSKLKSRQSAELEDEIFSRINSTNNREVGLRLVRGNDV